MILCLRPPPPPGQAKRDLRIQFRLFLPHGKFDLGPFGRLESLSQLAEIAVVAHDEACLKLRGRDGGDEFVEWVVGKSMDDGVEVDPDVAEGIARREFCSRCLKTKYQIPPIVRTLEFYAPRKSEECQVSRSMVPEQASIISCTSRQNCRSTVRNRTPFCIEAGSRMKSWSGIPDSLSRMGGEYMIVGTWGSWASTLLIPPQRGSRG